jgi:signal transduction histidine kinase
MSLWPTRSTTGQFLILHVSLTLLSTVPVLSLVYYQTDRALVATYRQRISDREKAMLFHYRRGGIAELKRWIDQRVATGTTGDTAVLVADPSGRKIAGNLTGWPPTITHDVGWREMRLYREGHDHTERFAISARMLPSGYRMLTGTPIDVRAKVRDALFRGFAGAALLYMLLTFLAALLVYRIFKRASDAILDVTGAIAAGDFTRRVRQTSANETFQAISNAINRMLDKIEALMSQLRFLTDSLAHDLRSPLMRIRVSLETATTHSSDATALHALEKVSSEVQGMMGTLTTTLQTSRAEAGIGRENFGRFDLGGLLKDLCEMYHPLAQDLAMDLAIEAPRSIEYFGSRELMGQAVSNLIDNAIKYARSGGQIRLGVTETSECLLLHVADRGPGIPEHQRDEAVEKYHRLGPARTSEGSGLGLALVNAIARLHDGQLLLEDNAPGLRIVLRLPHLNGAEADSALAPG